VERAPAPRLVGRGLHRRGWGEREPLAVVAHPHSGAAGPRARPASVTATCACSSSPFWARR
jgi:hypothetical protein